MSIFFWKREQEIEQLMDSYMDEVHSCLDGFQECLCALFEDSTSEKSKELVERVDKAESRSDDFRHDLEFELYSKALMPESRGDLLGLVEAIDRIPNWAEETVYDIYLQRVVFPKNLMAQFRELAAMNVQCFQILHKAIVALFENLDAVSQLTQDVDRLEGKIDNLERELIRAVFDIEERLSYQNLLHRIIRSICDISDKSENVADRLVVLAAKRRI
jgi:predicted phosphate transport protein (TIGR00153 family)